MLIEAIKNTNYLIEEYTNLVLESCIVPVSKELGVYRDSLVRDRLKEVQESGWDRGIKRQYIKALIITFLVSKPVPFLGIPYPKSWFYEFLIQGLAEQLFSHYSFSRVAEFLHYTYLETPNHLWSLMHDKVREVKLIRREKIAEDYETKGFIAFVLNRFVQRLATSCLQNEIPKGGLGFLAHLEKIVDKVDTSILRKAGEFKIANGVFLRYGAEHQLRERFGESDILFSLEQLMFSHYFFNKSIVNPEMKGDFSAGIFLKDNSNIELLVNYISQLFVFWVNYVNNCSVLQLKQLLKAVPFKNLKEHYWSQVGGMLDTYVLIPSRCYLNRLIKSLGVIDGDIQVRLKKRTLIPIGG